jgi:hypothetical protein
MADLSELNTALSNESEQQATAGPSTQGHSSQVMGSTKVTNGQLVAVFRKKLKDEKEQKECLALLIGHAENQLDTIITKINNLKSTFYKKWEKYCRKEAPFKNGCKDWLDLGFVYPKAEIIPEIPEEEVEMLSQNIPDISPSEGIKRKGRPTLGWDEKSDIRKRALVKDLSDELSEKPLKMLLAVAAKSAKSESNDNISFILNQLISDPSTAAKLVACLKEKPKEMQAYTPEEALSLIINQNLTVDTYNVLRKEAKSRGHALYPPYYQVLAMKESCRPKTELTVTDRSCTVPLKDLLQHTADRIVTLQDEYLNRYFENKQTNEFQFCMQFSWGFDGSSGQSQYKQKLEDSDISGDDHSLFVTTVIPLKLSTEEECIWLNPTPQSVRYCRPLRIQFAKETSDLIKSTRDEVNEEFSQMGLFELVTSQGNKVIIKFELYLTVIDGKVLSIINDTPSQQTCPMCGATPKLMNTACDFGSRTNDESLKHGISPLHAWIRMLELCLHIGYRNVDGLRSWQVRGPVAKKIFEQRKKQIQQEVFAEIGIYVDFVRQNAGTSNDGNTARMAFNEKNRATFARILNLDEGFVYDLFIILVVISSGLPIDSEKFGEFCKSVCQKYLALYKWYYMPVTLHKILIHGEEIIKNSRLPLGMLSEQAGESRNKLYRRYRETHARKTSRKHNLIDVFNRSMDSSDPILSQYSLKTRQKNLLRQTLPSAAIQLLQAPTEPVSLLPHIAEENESIEDYELEIDEILDGFEMEPISDDSNSDERDTNDKVEESMDIN